MRRVVVTGIGMCAPLGYGADYCWERLINSESGIDKLTGFDTEDLSSKVGGQIPLEGNEDIFLDNVIEIKDKRKIETFIQYALSASKEAIQDSGWVPKNDEEASRTGVLIGSGIGGLQSIAKANETLKEKGPKIRLRRFRRKFQK